MGYGHGQPEGNEKVEHDSYQRINRLATRYLPGGAVYTGGGPYGDIRRAKAQYRSR